MARAGKDQQDKAKAESKKKAEQAKNPMNELVKVLEQNTKTMNKLLTGLNSLTRDSLAKQPSQKSPEEIEKAQLQNALMKENLKHKQLENERYEKENKIKVKEASRNDYKENIVYRAGANIAGQKSSTMASLALSTLTGGIINPVIAKSFGLDKLFSAGFNATGRVLGHTSNMAYRGVKSGVGALGRGIKNIFTNDDDEVQEETSSPRPSKGKSRKRDSSAVAADTDKQGKILKSVEGIEKALNSKKEEKQEEKKDAEENPVFAALKKAAVGLGLAFMAVKTGIMDFLGEKIGEAGAKVAQFFGMSEEGGGKIKDLLKDALPGAIAGLPFGLKGALVGGAISMAAGMLRDFRKMVGQFGGDKQENANTMGWGEAMLKGAITGGIAGSLIPGGGIKAIGIGIMIGAVGGLIAKTIAKVKAWWENFSVADFSKDLGDSALKMVLGDNLGGKASNALGWSKEAREDEKKKESLNKATERRLQNEDHLRKALNVFGENDFIELYGHGDENNLTTSERRILNEHRKKSGPVKWRTLGGQADVELAPQMPQTPVPNDLGYTPMPKDLGYTPMPDNQGGGYGSFNTSNMSDDVVIHNRQAKAMKSMGLSGSIASINSIPFVAEQNEESLKNLDSALKSWGYEVVYTSAMGGHRPGTGHWKGNKVDLQLKKNGQPTHLANHQLQALRKAGYWGSGTGALGWEPVSGQVGGGHYDLFLGHGGGSINTSETKYADAGGRAGNTVERMESQSASTSEDMMSMNMAEMNGNLQASLSRPSGGASSSPVAAAMNDTMPFTSGSAGPISMPSSDNFNLSGLGSMGGASAGPNNKTGTVYAYGDVAKTAILHTT